MKSFVDVISRRLSEGVGAEKALLDWIGDESIQEKSAARGRSLHKEQIGAVHFM